MAMCNMCLFRLVACTHHGCVWFLLDWDRGNTLFTQQNWEVQRTPEAFVCFLRRTRVGFVDSLARQVAARTAAARCGVGPKVMFPAGQSLRVEAG